MKKRLVALTLALVTVFGSIGFTNTETVSAAPVATDLSNATKPIKAPMPDTAIFHRDRETKQMIYDMFDPSFYAAAYADLSLAFNIEDPYNLTQDQKDLLWKHFWNGGIWEGRTCNSEFNVNVYSSSYGDLQEAYGRDIIAYYIHYAKNAEAEERTITTVSAAIEANVPVYQVYSYEKGTVGVANVIVAYVPLVDPVKIKQEEEAAKNPVVPSTPSDSNSSSSSSDSKPVVDDNYAEGNNPYGVPYKGRCIQKDYLAWIAAGNAAEDYAPMPSLFVDSVGFVEAVNDFYARTPDTRVYLMLTDWDDVYSAYCIAHGDWEFQMKYTPGYNEPEPVCPNEREYLEQTDYYEDLEAWSHSQPHIRDFCPDYTGPEPVL